jgi:hypothetical protein
VPQWSITREAQETVARESDGVAGLEYGREIMLPGDIEPRLKAVAAAADIPTASHHATAPALTATPTAAQTMVVTADARQAESGELIVPVTIARGAAQEIVLRIVLKLEDREG